MPAAHGPLVTLLRHGETEWSRSGQHTGVTDVPLTAEGEVQARAARRLLPVAPGDYDLVLTSPRVRARRTAELAGLAGAVVDDDLAEWDYGDLEGMTSDQIHEGIPGWTIWDGPWPGGETAADVTARVDRLLDRVRDRAPGERVALVAHGHILRVVGARWIAEPAAAGRWLALDTAAVCELGWEHSSPVVRRWDLTADAIAPA